MKKICMLLFLVALLSSIAFPAVAQSDNVAYVQGKTSDRVHLRAQKSSDSASQGLYFSGTPVFIPFGNGHDEWTYVVIGSEQGYMHTSMLASADHYNVEQSEWKQATVDASGWVNMRSAPTKEAPVLSKIDDGDIVAVLGETVDRWCYVKANDNYGYIMSQYLNVGKERYDEPVSENLNIPSISLPADFFFCSGAGAWSTQIAIMPDGRIWGYFHDSDMGVVDKEYPNGTFYECSFVGKFADVRKIKDWEYQITVENLQSFGIPENIEIQDKVRVISTTPYGLSDGECFSVYLSNAPMNRLPKEYLDWIGPNEDHTIGLYGHVGQMGWRID